MSELIFEQWDREFRAPTDEADALARFVERQEALAQDLEKYEAQYVALCGSEIVAADTTLRGLLKAVGDRRIDGTIWVIPSSDGASFFLDQAA